MPTSKKLKRLLDAYRFAGFRPMPQVSGVFGDAHARVIRLARRLSLSANRLSRVRQVLFLVTGSGKQGAVARWKSGEPIPAAAIHCANGVDVLLDNAAWPKEHSP